MTNLSLIYVVFLEGNINTAVKRIIEDISYNSYNTGFFKKIWTIKERSHEESFKYFWKTLCNSLWEWVFVALGIQHVMRMHYSVISGLLVSAILYHIISYSVRFWRKKNLLNIRSVYWFPLQLLSQIILILSGCW